jgi:hypothetical protein
MALGAARIRAGAASHGMARSRGRTPDAHEIVHGTGHVPLGNGGMGQHVRSANVLVKRDEKALAGTTRNALGRVVVPKVAGSSPVGHPMPSLQLGRHFMPHGRAVPLAPSHGSVRAGSVRALVWAHLGGRQGIPSLWDQRGAACLEARRKPSFDG